MPTAKMKDGRTIEVPLEELEVFLLQQSEQIELQEEDGVPIRSVPDLNGFPFKQTAELFHQS
jgi:hypothetical protein